MPVFQIEMLWDCRTCKAVRNRGLEKHCKSCGHPKDEKDREYIPDHVTVADAIHGEAEADAEAGPDWSCKFCASLQSTRHACCTECGVPKGQGERPRSATDVEAAATFDAGTGDRLDPHSPEDTPIPPLPTIKPPSLPSPVVEIAPEPWEAIAFSPRARLRRFLLVLGMSLPVILLGWLLLRTTIHGVVVESVSWHHEIEIERYKIFHREGWTIEPASFGVQDQGPRVHHHDHVLVGSHREDYTAREACGEDCTTVAGSCYTTSVTCTSNNNGAATCRGGDRTCSPDRQSCSTRYCDVAKTRTVDDYEDQPRYQDWYTWNVWDWGHDRVVAATGATTETRWPSEAELTPDHLAYGEKERLGKKAVQYDILFTECPSDGKGKSESWILNPKTEDEFKRYPPASRWRIKTGTVHGIEVLGPWEGTR